MKNILNQILLNNLVARTALGRQRPRNNLYTRKMWRPNRNRSNALRRIRRNKRTTQIEINKAIGGNKQLHNNGRTQIQTIEFYSSIALPDPTFVYIFEGVNTSTYDIAGSLNDQNEFLNLRKRALQYKVQQVAISFNYNRIPSANDKFSKLLVTPESDMVLEVEDPKINSNTMVWDMTANGTKNYNFKITNRNTEKINQEWHTGDSDWSAVLKIHLSAQGENKIYKPNDQTIPTFSLGEVKFSVQIVYIQIDSDAVIDRVTQRDAIAYVKNTFGEEILAKKKQRHLEFLLAEQEKINSKIKKLEADEADNISDFKLE